MATLEEIKRGMVNIDLKQLLMVILGSVNEDLSDKQQKKLIRLINAFQNVIYLHGIDSVYEDPTLIHIQMAYKNAVEEALMLSKSKDCSWV